MIGSLAKKRAPVKGASRPCYFEKEKGITICPADNETRADCRQMKSVLMSEVLQITMWMTYMDV